MSVANGRSQPPGMQTKTRGRSDCYEHIENAATKEAEARCDSTYDISQGGGDIHPLIRAMAPCSFGEGTFIVGVATTNHSSIVFCCGVFMNL